MSFWIALYGAFLSTAVFIWNIYNKANDKGKLKITAYFGDAVIQPWAPAEDLKTVIYFVIVNNGSKPIVVSKLGGTYKKIYNEEVRSFTIHMNNQNKKLEPGDEMIEIFTNLSIINDKVKNLYVYDTLGTKYKMKNTILNQLLVEQKAIDIRN